MQTCYKHAVQCCAAVQLPIRSRLRFGTNVDVSHYSILSVEPACHSGAAGWGGTEAQPHRMHGQVRCRRGWFGCSRSVLRLLGPEGGQCFLPLPCEILVLTLRPRTEPRILARRLKLIPAPIAFHRRLHLKVTLFLRLSEAPATVTIKSHWCVQIKADWYHLTTARK